MKGFEIGNGDYIMIDPEEVAAVVPDSDKMLEADAFRQAPPPAVERSTLVS
jgi:DNA end-binding protein Ku